MFSKLLSAVAGLALMAGAASGADLVFKPGAQPDRFHWDSYTQFAKDHANLKGQTLTIFGPWRGQDQTLFENVLAYFEQATGVTVKYSSSENYEQQMVIDTQAGSPPNIGVLPQPGLIQDLASKGFIKPLPDTTKDWLLKNYAAGPSWVTLSTYKDKDGKDKLMAFPFKIDLKSLVWYSPGNYKDAGYTV
ncbi:MAG: extracellular solute-binding protein, partial [Paracoccaceae bacterium]|nr:extracellular solute-binding protein [Paracoccaceae bacterium]